MINHYLSQTAIWKRITAYDLYGQPITVQQSIPVRWEGVRRLVRNDKGEEVVSEARVFTTAPVQPGDILTFNDRDWPVLTVSDHTLLDGQVLYREAAL